MLEAAIRFLAACPHQIEHLGNAVDSLGEADSNCLSLFVLSMQQQHYILSSNPAQFGGGGSKTELLGAKIVVMLPCLKYESGDHSPSIPVCRRLY